MLVDTSVWVDHLRRGDSILRDRLQAGEVECHEFVIGELACGTIHNRKKILLLLGQLPQVATASRQDALRLLEAQRLVSLGLGWVDIHLLASALIAKSSLWTRDRRLRDISERLGISGQSP